MLSEVQKRGIAAGQTAAAAARETLALRLSEVLPGVSVRIVDDAIVLFGRLDVDDERLRWLARYL